MLICLILLLPLNLLLSQQYQFAGDTIEVEMKGYYSGQIQWQNSTDKINWSNVAAANNATQKLIMKQNSFFRAKVTNCDIVNFSDTITINDLYRIEDINENIKITWPKVIDFNLLNYKIIIEGIDTVIIVDKSINSLTIPRKMSYYGKKFIILPILSNNITQPKFTVLYENNYSRFFTCKNKYIAHRGLSSIYPENTRISFEKAADAGFEYIECDVWLTRDKQWVVIHDSNINRTSDGEGSVSEYSLDELRKFNFGYPKLYGNKYPQQILSINDFVDICFVKNVKPLIEIKDGNFKDLDVKNLLKIVTNKLSYDQFAFHSFITLNSFRNIDKEVILGFLTSTFNPNHSIILDNLYPSFYNLDRSNAMLNQTFSKTSNYNLFKYFTRGTFVGLWTIDEQVYFQNLTNNNIFVTTNIRPASFK